MSLFKKMKEASYWVNFSKIALPFFVIFVVISLLWHSGSAIFSGDFETVNELNFSNGKWKAFFGSKLIGSIIYGIWTTSRKTK